MYSETEYAANSRGKEIYVNVRHDKTLEFQEKTKEIERRYIENSFDVHDAEKESAIADIVKLEKIVLENRKYAIEEHTDEEEVN